METNLCRKGIWHVGPLQLALPIDGADTLGLLRVAGPPLTSFDLDVMAWLTERRLLAGAGERIAAADKSFVGVELRRTGSSSSVR